MFDLLIQGRHVQFEDLTDHSADSLSSCLFHRAHSSRHCSSRICLLAAAASSVSPERRGSSASGFLWMFNSSNRCESQSTLIVCFCNQQVAFADNWWLPCGLSRRLWAWVNHLLSNSSSWSFLFVLDLFFDHLHILTTIWALGSTCSTFLLTSWNWCWISCSLTFEEVWSYLPQKAYERVRYCLVMRLEVSLFAGYWFWSLLLDPDSGALIDSSIGLNLQDSAGRLFSQDFQNCNHFEPASPAYYLPLMRYLGNGQRSWWIYLPLRHILHLLSPLSTYSLQSQTI